MVVAVVVAAVVAPAVVAAAVVAAVPGQATFLVTLMKKNLVKLQAHTCPGFEGQKLALQQRWHPIQGFRTKQLVPPALTIVLQAMH